MARKSASAISPELPIQAPVEQPILNSPFYEPKEHWVYDKAGKANRIGGRRSARYWWTTQRTVTGQTELEGIGADFGSEPLPLVNALRADLARWRATGYENATTTTKELLRHWQGKDRSRRLFFCQIEAVETVIYLTEILAAGRKTRWNPEVTVDDYRKMQCGEKPDLAHMMSDDFFPRLADGPGGEDWKALTRVGCKMATGSGKTVVMAMIIAWSFCNRGRIPGDIRFPNTVLVCCPNLTVRERLQVLRPDYPKGTYFEQFDIVPARMRGLLHQGKVHVTNWHAFAPESPHAEGGTSYAVVNKGEESADAFARRVLHDLYGRGPILVLNDEAHHAWRPAPPEKAKNAGAPRGDEGVVDEVTEDEAKEATVWVDGLDKLNQAVGVAACIDLSATPFYLNGSGHIPGSPFPWLVTDFGLVDAIESGITKIPRLPVSDESGRPDPKFFRLWDEIKAHCQPADKVRGKPKPEVVWREAQPAFLTLAAEWQERFKYHESAKQGQQFIPPVIIVVCDNVQIAQVFFEMISGETEEEIEGDDGKKHKIKRYNPGGVPFPLLANTERKQVTIRIDTELLNQAEAGVGMTKDKEAQRLRELVSNVGTKGTPGEHIRCVVSVQMLTEGWDANNVTQILGLRAFGSQLLCEQVVGRGLRRIDYTFDPVTEMLSPEYVDVFGIPFSVIPFKGRPKNTPEPEDKPKNYVTALPERSRYEIRFPRVTGYVVDLARPAIRCDVSKVEHLTIQTMENPTEVFVSPQVGIRTGDLGSLSFETTKLDREEFYANHHFQTVLFELARVIVNRLTDTAHSNFRMFSRQQLFPQVLSIVRQYADTRIHWNGVDKRELALVKYAQPLIERLTAAIVPDEARGEPPILPVIDRFNPWGSSADVSFSTQRQCHPTVKSHVDQVVLDTQQWERSVAFRLESSEAVEFYVRNDHMDFLVPYEFMGVSHAFFPDFIVRLTNGVNLVLEVKGLIGEQEKAKFEAARRWCAAVTNWGKIGKWEFHVSKNPETIKAELNSLATPKNTPLSGHGDPDLIWSPGMPSGKSFASPKVFLSHSSRDKAFVSRLEADFGAAEIPVWFDSKEIDLGDSITRTIGTGLEDSDYLLLVHSKNSAGSEWVKRELEVALNMQINGGGIAVLAAVLDGTPLPPMLIDRLFVDFQKGYEKGRDRLIHFFKSEAAKVGTGGSFGVPPNSIGHRTHGGDDCPTRLSRLTQRELRKRMQSALNRDEISVAWYDLLGEPMDDVLPGKAKDYCLIELIERCKRRKITDGLLKILCEDWPHVDGQ